jgi:hypothetical protein
MKIDIEYFELMRQQYVALFAEQMRAIKALAAELHGINCLYRQLRSSVPHDELVNSRREAIARAQAAQRDETVKVS